MYWYINLYTNCIAMMSEDVQFYESLYKLDTDVVLRCNVIANSVKLLTEDDVC